MAKVYVSSTYLDLQDYRRQVSLVLRKMGYEDVAMEYYTAEDKRPVDKCLSDVAACDLYIGIFAWRYGWIPKKNNRRKLSITEMEFRRAAKEGKKCLIFLLDGKTSWPPDFIDDDKTRIRKLRDELAEEHGAGLFTSADNLASQVSAAVHNWAREQGHLSSSILIPEFDLTTYYEALVKRYQRLDLDALTPPQKEEYLQLQLRAVFVEQNVRENPPPVELPKEVWEKLQRDQEIHPEDLPTGIMPDDVLRARESYYEKPSRPVLDALTDPRYQHSIVLGDPGSGKSTLARYVLLSLISDSTDEKLSRAFNNYLPLLIELRSYVGLCEEDKCNTFIEFLSYLSQNEGWQLNEEALKHYLKTDGRAVVIFDGLDEIFDPDHREQIARRIVGFTLEYPKARVIVTSRVIGYRRKILTDAGFVHFTLQDLDEGQVGTFVDRWYALALSDRPDEARARRERIMRSFGESASIRQLAGNPMLLTIMAIIGKNQELPRERWKLYDHAASVLIQHWDVDKHLKDRNLNADFIGEEDKKELLRRLAYHMQAGAGGLAGNYIHREKLEEEFENYLTERYKETPARAKTIALAMIDQFRERNFILSLYGANLYGFVHRAFLEYFCATAFTHKFEKTREMTIDELKQDVYGAHWEDRSWHEVLRLICGLIDEKFAGEIISFLADEERYPLSEYSQDRLPWNVVLAVQCLSEVRNLGSVEEAAKRSLLAMCSLLGHEMKKGEWFGFIINSVVPSTEMIGSHWPHRELLVEWLNEYQPSVLARSYAEPFGQFVGSVGKGLQELYDALLDYATHSDDNYRVFAPLALAKGWHDSQTLTLLRELAVKDDAAYVRQKAVEALARYFQDDPQTLLLLRDRAVMDSTIRVRIEAIWRLGDYFRDDADTLPLLHDCAVNDPHDFVRSAAIEMLVKHFKDDNQTLLILHDRAVNDESPSVGRRDDTDFRFSVRSNVLELLSQYWAVHPDTLPLLQERAKNDPVKWLRKKAQRLADELQTQIQL
jgi:hypothetical protein